MKACPEFAIEINELNGIVVIRNDTCTGCRQCEEACPYNAIRYDEEQLKVFKCDFCEGDPACVKWCPVNALGIVEFGGQFPL